ncbi:MULTISPECIES: hypothetical protein [Stenotrophomonas]|uniref:hypothetical protein n=1 Tax=Stenotrophomonas TaxID=40323 RepID=UPI001180FD0B|nr:MULTISPECIES: hypothetical protein [Stenotrophomonas]MBL0734900.1 hypothetical protein [Stenotrophomonas maltophilia]MBL0755265.1 hypothetical protein [Stenotrophomonas maltophilia]
MTLVIAAHSLPNEPAGLWFAADSMISRDRPVLCEYRKIYNVVVRVNAPRFRAHQIHAFDNVILEHSIAVAFAGDLTTAHHILNQITDHLGSLIAYQDDEGKPTLSMACSFDSSRARRTHFDPHQYPNYHASTSLLTADFIADVARHAFNLAVQSGRRYKFNEDEIKHLFAQLVIGIQCPSTGTFHLMSLFPLFPAPNYFPDVRMKRIQPGKVVTIGVPSQEAAAQACHDEAQKGGKPLGESLFSHLTALVDGNSIPSIGHPCVLRKLTSNGLELVKTTGLPAGAGDANPNLKGKDHIPVQM